MIGFGFTLTPGRAGAGAFSPAQTDPLVWLTASAGVETATGVSAWRDQGAQGNDALQATGAAQPGVITDWRNGRPALDFDGVAQSLEIAGFTGGSSSQPHTIYAVGAWSASAGDSTLFDGYLTTRHILYGDSASNIQVGGGSFAVVGTEPAAGTPFVARVTFNGAATTFKLVPLGGTVQTATVNGGTAPLDGMTIGSSRGGSTSFWDGPIAEILNIPRAVGAQEDDKLFAYLQSFYAINPA